MVSSSCADTASGQLSAAVTRASSSHFRGSGELAARSSGSRSPDLLWCGALDHRLQGPVSPDVRHVPRILVCALAVLRAHQPRNVCQHARFKVVPPYGPSDAAERPRGQVENYLLIDVQQRHVPRRVLDQPHVCIDRDGGGTDELGAATAASETCRHERCMRLSAARPSKPSTAKAQLLR